MWSILFKLGLYWLICLILILILKFFENKLIKKKNSINIKYLFSLVNLVLIFLCFYYCLTLFDTTKELSKTILKSSALLLAIVTFAAQQALGNVISGFTLSLTKPYDVGQKIKVIQNGNIIAEGIVKDITIRHSIIKAFDGNSFIIPNNIMDNSVIVNTNYTDNVGNFVEIEVRQDQNIDKAMLIFKDIVIKHNLTLNTESDTNITLNRYTQNGFVLKTAVWTKKLDDNFKACSDIRIDLLKAYKENDIIIPYNTVSLEK